MLAIFGTPFRTRRAIQFPDQARFHAIKYVKGLIGALEKRDVPILGDTRVLSVQETKDGVRLETEGGFDVRAQHAVIATNSPVNDLVALHTKQAPYRSYVFASPVQKGRVPDALIWDTEDPYHYVRIQPGETDDLLIVGGADHKSGTEDDAGQRIEGLRHWAETLFGPLAAPEYAWSGQVYEPVDHVSFAGLNPGSKRTYVITGDSGEGLTSGVAGALLIASALEGHADRETEELYDPARKSLLAIGTFVRENVDVPMNLAEHLTGGEVASLDALNPGEGGLVRRGLEKIAAYRDDAGEIHCVSSHMHPSGVCRALQQFRALLGLPVPRVAIRDRRRRSGRTGANAAPQDRTRRMSLQQTLHTALDELRMQMLGTQVLFGFQFQGVFQEGFPSVPAAAKAAVLAGFALIVVTLGLLVAPAAQHRLVERGIATRRVLSVANRFAERALATYALAIGLDVFAVADGYFGQGLSAAAAAIAVLTAVILWYAPGFWIRATRKQRKPAMPEKEEPQLHEKIDQMLTESRVILPGAQALLGFQFVVTMTKAFHDLPPFAQDVHFCALALILLAVTLLIAPAAVHRLGFGGAFVERMHTVGSALVTAALVPLAAGIAADLYVAFGKVAPGPLAPAAAIAGFLLLVTLWYVLPLCIRATRAGR